MTTPTQPPVSVGDWVTGSDGQTWRLLEGTMRLAERCWGGEIVGIAVRGAQFAEGGLSSGTSLSLSVT